MIGCLLVFSVPSGWVVDPDGLDLVVVLRRSLPDGGRVRQPQPPLEQPPWPCLSLWCGSHVGL